MLSKDREHSCVMVLVPEWFARPVIEGMRDRHMEFKTSGETAIGRRVAFSQVIRHPVVKAMGVVAIALAVANCSQNRAGGIDKKYGVRASPRVIAEGQAVPKGGGRSLVGKPYVIAGRTYVPQHSPNYSAVGLASWYGSAFHGRLTANGEVFDRYSIAAAHPTMPLPSYARVTNLKNRKSMIVRVNDRGPYHANRVMDVSQTVAEALDFKRVGTANVRVEYVGRASLNGSDDNVLLASLRSDGLPAQLGQPHKPTMLAKADIPEDTDAAALQATPVVRGFDTAPAMEPAAPVLEHVQEPLPLPPVRVAFDDDIQPLQPVLLNATPSMIPLPPQRPITLGHAEPVSKQQVASLSYLPSEHQGAGSHSHINAPFSSTSTKGFVPLKK